MCVALSVFNVSPHGGMWVGLCSVTVAFPGHSQLVCCRSDFRGHTHLHCCRSELKLELRECFIVYTVPISMSYFFSVIVR